MKKTPTYAAVIKNGLNHVVAAPMAYGDHIAFMTALAAAFPDRLDHTDYDPRLIVALARDLEASRLNGTIYDDQARQIQLELATVQGDYLASNGVFTNTPEWKERDYVNHATADARNRWHHGEYRQGQMPPVRNPGRLHSTPDPARMPPMPPATHDETGRPLGPCDPITKPIPESLASAQAAHLDAVTEWHAANGELVALRKAVQAADARVKAAESALEKARIAYVQVAKH